MNYSGGVRPGQKARRTTKIKRVLAGPINTVRPLGRPLGGTQKRPQQQGPKKRPQNKSAYKDQQFFNDLSGATLKRESALNSLTSQRGQVEIGYGFNTDPATNPYSRAALLQRSYDRAQRGTLNSMAAAGQLYSGAHSNARAGNTENYNQNYDALRKSYDAELDRIRGTEADARSEYTRSVGAAGQEAINRAAQDRPTAETAGFGRKKKSKRGKKGRK